MAKKVFARSLDHTLHFCCGVGEPGGWSFVERPDSWSRNVALENLNKPGTGLFVVTFTKAPTCQAALKELLEKHTVLFNTDYLPTTSAYASEIGKKHGIALYVFNFGKEESK